VINHPSHEMMPAEHRLSQNVLEFLIAQQDWFMMDVPPPPRRDSIMGPMQPSPQGVFIVPNDRDEDPAEGSWKLIEHGQTGLDRRRTTTERGSVKRPPTVKVQELVYEDDYPEGEQMASEHGEGLRRRGSLEERVSQDETLAVGAASVKRSTTAPSRRSSVGAAGAITVTDSPKGSTRRRLQKAPHPPSGDYEKDERVQ